MVSKELLEILQCPQSRQPLAEAPAELIKRLNAAINAGTIHNQAGEKVAKHLAAGLLRQDGTMLYPVVDDIPIMLVDESIDVSALR